MHYPGKFSCSNGPGNRSFIFTLVVLLSFFPSVVSSLSIADTKIAAYQSSLKSRPVGDRIVFWAERFLGIPYDKDPRGFYVSKEVIVADQRVDCMYLTFRTVELALSSSPAEAVEVALDKRFHTRGVLQNGRVVNYSDRFEYGEDMIDSGKWGREVTAEIGKTRNVEGSRGKACAAFVSSKDLKEGMDRLKNGDILFFIRDPGKRVQDEIVGHIGIVKVEPSTGQGRPSKTVLIHASGNKRNGGVVKKVPLAGYIKKMSYIGVRITRF